MANLIHRGSCLCGGVRYEVAGEIEAVSHCHCSMCRKGHGAAFGTYGSVRRDKHVFTEGVSLIREYQSSEWVTRMFCSRCGSPLLWRSEGRFAEWVSFSMGTLDTSCDIPPQKHIHVASKALWYVIDDHWPQYAEY